VRQCRMGGFLGHNGGIDGYSTIAQTRFPERLA
jgi:hypothetical protein